MENTSIRLKKIMRDRNLKQIDILNMAKPICKKYSTRLGKNDLSQYISGKVEPGQWKLFILSETLNVSEGWLMGLNVPMEREIYDNEMNLILNFGFTLFELLRYYKISKEELANRLNIDIDTISKAVNGEKLPNKNEIQKIADYFNIKEKNDLFDNTTYNNLRKNYFENENVPEDKYRFGFELESMFEKISEEINQPLDELKQIFMNKNNKTLNNSLKLTYDNLKDFFVNYFESQKKPLDELDILFSKHKDILTDEDKEYMRFIIEKRKKEIDKQLGED